MFRKLVLALGASVIIGAAALSPASAHGWHHGWHHGWRHGWHHWHHGFGVSFYAPSYDGDCYFVPRVVWTPWGKRIRRVEVCD